MSLRCRNSDACSRRLCGPVLPALWLLAELLLSVRLQLSSKLQLYPAGSGYYPNRYGYGSTGYGSTGDYYRNYSGTRSGPQITFTLP